MYTQLATHYGLARTATELSQSPLSVSYPSHIYEYNTARINESCQAITMGDK